MYTTVAVISSYRTRAHENRLAFSHRTKKQISFGARFAVELLETQYSLFHRRFSGYFSIYRFERIRPCVRPYVRVHVTIYQNIIRPFSILSTNTFKVRRHWKYTETFPSALTTWHFRGFGTEPEIPALPIVARRNRKSLQLTEQRACYSLIDVRKRPIRVTIRRALFFETNELA